MTEEELKKGRGKRAEGSGVSEGAHMGTLRPPQGKCMAVTVPAVATTPLKRKLSRPPTHLLKGSMFASHKPLPLKFRCTGYKYVPNVAQDILTLKHESLFI